MAGNPEEHLLVGLENLMHRRHRLGNKTGGIDPFSIIPQGTLQRAMKDDNGRRLFVVAQLRPQPCQLLLGHAGKEVGMVC